MTEFMQLNNKYEVLTPSGWSDFSGVKKTIKIGAYKFTIERPDGKIIELICSKKHVLKLYNGEFVNAFDVYDGYGLYGGLVVKKREELEEKSYEFFDLLDVEKENEYYTNGVVSHNCAHIPESVVTELWLSVYPTLSTGGSAILISTPNGTNNLFYRLWSEAKEGENNFVTMELPWQVHPERDETWYKSEAAAVRAAKGERGVLQEFHCVFIGSGDTFINADILATLESNCKKEIQKSELHQSLDIFEKPEPNRKYLITADVASGTAADFSTMCVVDLETGEVVADFKHKISPQEFTPILRQTAEYYNEAVICPEMNSYGLIVSETLRKEKYPKLYYPTMNSLLEVDAYEAEQFEMPGWKTHEGTRPDMLAKLDFMLSTGKLKVNSKRFLDELKNFIWKDNKPQAAKKKNDDLVIAYSIAAKLLSTIDEEIISDDAKLLSLDELNSMLEGFGIQKKTLDVAAKQIVITDVKIKNEDDKNKPMIWIF